MNRRVHDAAIEETGNGEELRITRWQERREGEARTSGSEGEWGRTSRSSVNGAEQA